MRIARVFPTRTSASPTDDLAFFGPPPFYAQADEVHISVTFTWDLSYSFWLAEQWRHVGPVQMGGPGTGQAAGDFIPGRYLQPGYTITSRGCPNKCWFCSAWKREPRLRELPIHDGWLLQDDNILACSESHIKNVFTMLTQQPQRCELRSLEAKLIKPWHVEALTNLKPAQMFFAYDTADDYEPLVNAARLLREAGFTRNTLRCYVLIGYPSDTFEEANRRLHQTVDLGIFPFAMLWHDDDGSIREDWRSFQRPWARPAIIAAQTKAAAPSNQTSLFQTGGG